MTFSTISAVATSAAAKDVASKVIKYIRDDLSHSYGLASRVRLQVRGDGMNRLLGLTAIREFRFTARDWSFSLHLKGSDTVDFDAGPFPASLAIWNGPNVIPNNQFRSMLASLFHDLIWGHADELAKAFGVTRQAVLRWGNGILYAVWIYASDSSRSGRLEARLAWYACEFSRHWFHPVMRLLHALGFATSTVCVCVVLGGCAGGCAPPPGWTVVRLEGADAVQRVLAGDTEGASTNSFASPPDFSATAPQP